jgi:hypothetical protein
MPSTHSLYLSTLAAAGISATVLLAPLPARSYRDEAWLLEPTPEMAAQEGPVMASAAPTLTIAETRTTCC